MLLSRRTGKYVSGSFDFEIDVAKCLRPRNVTARLMDLRLCTEVLQLSMGKRVMLAGTKLGSMERA